MAAEGSAAGPEAGRDGLLQCISDLQRIDTAGAVGQVINELRPEHRVGITTWDDVIRKIQAREYTMYGALHQDVQAVISVLGIPDKKRSKLQKTCAKVMKDMKRHWSATEVQVRTHLYSWHPLGGSKANEVRRCPSVDSTCI
jgi:hypothetical protein